MTPAERYRAARSDPEQVVIEGLHALKHALRFGAEVVDVRTRDPASLRDLAESLAPDVAPRIVELAQAVDDGVFGSLAPHAHATGVIGLARRPAVDLQAVLDDPAPGRLVLLERPTHHGNIGAVVRVAAAAGAAGVLVTGRHDPWHPASIRGGAGLQFSLPVARLGPDDLEVVLAARPIVALDPGGEPLGWGGAGGPVIPTRAVLAFGSEREGVTASLLGRAQLRIAIPMRPGVSSLNLATAVAVTLYAAG